MPTHNPHLALADAAEQRANAATPGPWIHLPECANEYKIASQARPPMSFGFYEPPDDGLEPLGIGQTCQGDCRADLNFIAHARQDVPALAAAVREQAATIAALEDENVELRQALVASRNFHIRVIDTIPGATWGAVEDRWDALETLIDKALNSETRAAAERLKEAK